MNYTFNAAGAWDESTGFGSAFRMHANVLKECGEVKEFRFNEQFVPDSSIGYVHGSPHFVHKFPRHRRTIGYLVCETTELSLEYYKAAEHLDEIWTCSTFCQSVLKKLGLPVKLVPHYAKHFKPKPSGNATPKFLVVFNGNSRISRKNPVAALEAIKTAVPQAEVVLKLSNVDPVYLSWIDAAAKGLQVTYVEEALSEEGLLALYESVDILVSLHSSEGFGLHLLEMLAMGKAVVASAWGGNLDFMQPEVSFLVESQTIDCFDSYFPGQWGRPDFDHAVDQIRKAYVRVLQTGFAENVVQSVLPFSFASTLAATKAAL